MNKAWARFLIPLVLLLYSTSQTGARDFPMLHFKKEDGLTSNCVYQVYRDSKGFLWFGTDKGVVRYNGLKFEKYTTLNGLADNTIFSFQEDHQGRLWMATWNGKLCYFKEDSFHTESNTPWLKLPFSSAHIHNIILNTDSSLLFNFFDGSILLTISGNTISYHDIKTIYKKHTGYFNKRKTGPNRFVITSFNQETTIDSSAKILDVRKFTDDSIDINCYPAQNNYYFINKYNIYSENKNWIRPLKKSLSDASFINSYYCDEASWFISTNWGLSINDSIQIFEQDQVSSVTQDIKKNYWISTLNNGVYCLGKDFLKTSILPNSYEGKMKYVFIDSNQIFFTVINNNLYSFRNGMAKCLFNYQEYKKTAFKQPTEAGFAIQKTGDNYNYYNFYNDDFIIIKNLLSNKIVQLSKNPFTNLGIKWMIATDSDLYILCRQKVVCMDVTNPGNKINIKYECNENNSRIFAFTKSTENEIYYSTLKNVFKIDHDKSVIQSQFKNLSFFKFFFKSNYTVGLTFDYKLIICNEAGGEMFIDSVKSKECFWDNIFLLNDTQVVISTNDLYRILTLHPSNGIPQYSIQTIENPFAPLDAEYVCSDGDNCFFFKNNSITSLGINTLYGKPDPPELFLKSLKTSRKTYPIKGSLSLTYEETRNIILSFSTLSFSSREVFYQYQVSGKEDETWKDLRGEEINIYNLGFGDHHIKIRAKTNTSVYSQPILFTLHISRPWWATWWFISISVLFSLSFIYLVIKAIIVSHLKKRVKENEDKIRLIRAEYQSLNALMNPHFIFNTLNNVQSLYHENDLVAANEYLRIFADLVRQNMQNIAKELIPLQKEINLVENYLLLEKMRFEKKLNYEIIIDKDLDISGIMIPPLLIQPLVENSIKHGILHRANGKGEIMVNIFEQNDILFIEVRDNGIGINKSAAKKENGHEAMGIENIKKRIRQLSIIQNKEITFNITEKKNENGENEFTSVTISIPV